VSELELLTWNLNGLDEAALGPRVEAAVQDVLLGSRLEALLAAGAAPRPPPQVVVFQEVTRAMFHALLRPHLEKAGFTLHPGAPPDRTYFELGAVRAPARVLEHRAEPLDRSQYGRWQHALRLEHAGATWRVLHAHLDSGPEKATSAIREAQVRALAQQLEGGGAVFAGDTNLRDAEWRRAREGLALVDAWEAAGSDPSARFTWIGGHRKARFDRVWVTPDVEVRRFELVGDRPVAPGGAPPSDHLGVRVRVRVS
jgi:tyrosyl-DNA phosphodiesterase 2